MEVEMREVVGTDGKYSVTRCGRVWSHRARIFLKPGTIGKGYFKVSIRRFGGKTCNWYIHRLVAEAFLPNPENKLTVNHKSGDKSDNSADNLEWATQKEQVAHAIATGLTEANGEDNGSAKLTDELVLKIREEYSTKKFSHEDLGLKYEVSRACILDIVRGRTWTHLPHDTSCNVTRWRDRGASRKNACWTASQVREMRLRHAEGGWTTRRLAEVYGGHHGGVWAVVNFKSYTDQDHDLRVAA